MSSNLRFLKAALAVSLAMSLGACATTSSAADASSGEKGGLRPAKASSAAVDAAFKPRRFALVVGVGEFDDEQWRDLRFATKDARDVASALRDPSMGGFDRVVELSTSSDTSRESILRALDELARVANREEDIVVVYLSAHGTLARDARGELRRYLVTRDSTYRDISGTALSVDSLKAKLDTFGSRRRLMVLATCHSGGGKSLLPQELAQELQGIKSGFYAKPLEDASRAAMVLSASDWGETAREDENLQNDIYTHFLLEALDGQADRNGDGAVTAYEAHDHARRRTFAFTSGRQRPSAEIVEVGADPIVLAGAVANSGRPELYSYNPRFDGFTLKVDGEPRTELPGGASVKPGKVSIELTKGDDVLFRRSVTVNHGDRLDLDVLLRPAQPKRAVFLGGGMSYFMNRTVRDQIVPATPLAAASFQLDDLVLQGTSLMLDVGGSLGQSALPLAQGGDVPFSFQHYSLGVSLPWRVTAGRFRFFGGPKLSGLYTQRSFDLHYVHATQHHLTVAPGVVGGLGFSLTDSIELSVQGNLLMTWMTLDGKTSVVGSTGGWAGAGYRF